MSALAGLDAGQLVVQYAGFVPLDQDLYNVQPTSIDVYAESGARLAEGLRLEHRVLGGGPELLVLVRQPPDPWTVAGYRWRGSRN